MIFHGFFKDAGELVSIDKTDILSVTGPHEYGHGGVKNFYATIKLRNGDIHHVHETVQVIDDFRFEDVKWHAGQ